MINFLNVYTEENNFSFVSLRKFGEVFNEFLKERHLRVQTIRSIGRALRNEGFEIATRNLEEFGNRPTSAKVILNLRLKEDIIKTTRTTETTESKITPICS
jgi:restriction endonuclease